MPGPLISLLAIVGLGSVLDGTASGRGKMKRVHRRCTCGEHEECAARWYSGGGSSVEDMMACGRFKRDLMRQLGQKYVPPDGIVEPGRRDGDEHQRK